MRHWHPTFFPLALALLTLALIAFMVVAFSGGKASSLMANETPAVSDDAYQEQAKAVMVSFEAEYKAADDLAKLLLVEKTLNALLALRVPVSFKDLHLELAFSLNQMREGLRGDAKVRREGEAHLQKVLTDNPWLK